MTDPRRSPSGSGSGKDSRALLAEALRAKAGGTPSLGRTTGTRAGAASSAEQSTQPGTQPGSQPESDTRTGPALSMVQLILAATIAGFAVGILAAVISLL